MITVSSLGRYGRFANGLFQIAGCIGIAKRWGYDFAFKEWVNWDHSLRFGSTEDIWVQKYFVNPLPALNEGTEYNDYAFNWGYDNKWIPDNVSISGHFQSEKYFTHCLNDVRHYLRMKNEPELTEFCAVHWRAGDYEEGENVYHPRQTKDYYEKAMALFPSTTKFLVFSDDIEGAKKMLGNNVWYSDKNDYLADFAFMKRCSNYIIANSSYSLMAAILSEAENKKIVCPKNWFGKAWGAHYMNMTQDLYPENSIVI